MNYISEINAFYQWQETNPLSMSAANLWHAFMHVNNRAGWRKQFTVAMSVLCLKASMSKSTFKRARAELRDKGYIRYESRGGNQSAMYEIVSCVQSTMGRSDSGGANFGLVEDGRSDLRSGEWSGERAEVRSSLGANLDHKAGPLLDKTKTRQKASSAADGAIHFFKENFGELRPYIKRELIRWVDDLSEPLVLAGMERALDRGKVSWGYTKAILADWLEKGFESLEDVEGEVLAFREQGSGEVIPDWFHERGEEKEDLVAETAELEKERLEFEAFVAKYASG